MRISKELDSNVFLLTAAELSKTGWKKRRPGILTLDTHDESIGWLGLNTAHYRGGILKINPVIGVRHQRLEQLVAEFSGMKPHQYIPPSVSTNAGYLMPEKKYRVWSFQEGGNCEASVAEMAGAIEKFGRPFIQHNSHLVALHNALLSSKRGTPPDPRDYRIAVASLLLGRRTEAEEFLDVRLREIGNRSDPAAEWFKMFSTQLRAHLKELR